MSASELLFHTTDDKETQFLISTLTLIATVSVGANLFFFYAFGVCACRGEESASRYLQLAKDGEDGEDGEDGGDGEKPSR